MAAKSPAAVAISASAMPGPTVLRLDEPVAPICRNELMIPHTVPNSPMNGRDARGRREKRHRLSSFVISTVVARSSARSTASRLFRVGRPAAGDGFCGVGLRRPAAARSAPRSRTGTARRAGCPRASGQTACTSENLLLFRNTSRNVAVWRSSAPERPELVEDDPPGGGREQQQDQQERLWRAGWRP